jgi:predicted GNAT family N-acyltransferase
VSSNVIKLRPFLDESTNHELNEIHDIIYPEDIRRGEGITCEIKSDLNKEFKKFDIFRISPLGIEIFVDDYEFSKGLEISLKLNIHNNITSYHGLLVSVCREEFGRKLIGVRWFLKEKKTNFSTNNCDRNSKRWSTNFHFLPNGIANNPVRYNDFIYFKITNFSKTGFQLVTSLRNKFLIPGMNLESRVSFPLIGDFSVNFQVIHTNIVSGKLYVGCKLLDPDSSLIDAISNYIFQFNEKTSIKELSDHGLKVKKASTALQGGFVRTKDEYEEVLKLRHNAYLNAGKLEQDSSYSDCSDSYDTRARIFLARYRGKVVGSFRLIFHEDEDQLEHERFVNFDKRFPRKDQVVEVTRVCTHPDFRKSDILNYLMQQMILNTVLAGKKYIIGSAAKSLIGYYNKIGFDDTKVCFEHEDLNSLEHTMLVCNVINVITCKNISYSQWGRYYKDLASFLEEKKIYEFNPTEIIYLNLLRMIAPFLNFIFREKIK